MIDLGELDGLISEYYRAKVWPWNTQTSSDDRVTPVYHPSYSGFGGPPKAEEPETSPEEELRCPREGCQRPKPFETSSGKLRCWHCGFEAGWHDFPRRSGPVQTRD